MRLINFYGEVNRPRVEQLLQALQQSPQSHVRLASPGGTFEFFSVLAPSLARAGYTVVAEDVRSAAIVLQLLAHRRLAVPSATFFFHEVRAIIGPGLEVTVCDVSEASDRAREAKDLITAEGRDQLEEWEHRMKMAQSWMLQFIQGRTGVPQAIFLNLMRAEAVLTAREAMRYGIVHEIVPNQE